MTITRLSALAVLLFSLWAGRVDGAELYAVAGGHDVALFGAERFQQSSRDTPAELALFVLHGACQPMHRKDPAVTAHRLVHV